jgi:hypothetical protein
VFVTSAGSALTRFRRALAVHNGPAAYAAATELQRVELADALALTLLLADQRELFERLSVRWLGRFALEVRDVRQRHLHLLLAAFGTVRPGDPSGAQALAALCSSLGRDDLTAVLDNWLDRGGW